MLLPTPLHLRKPGLFLTATDTGVGKTVATCAIAQALRRQVPGLRLGVCKPLATGCQHTREGLVNEDAQALAYFADARQPLSVINPVRYVPPVAPAVAAEVTRTPVDFAAIARSLRVLDETCDALLIEGVGGLLVPIDDRDPQRTVLDLIAELRYPVAVVCRATLGTLNHTAMTVALLRARGCAVAGLIVNGYDADSSRSDPATDVAMHTNRPWLMKMTKLPVLATLPLCPAGEVQPHAGRLSEALVEAAAQTYWWDVLRAPASL